MYSRWDTMLSLFCYRYRDDLNTGDRDHGENAIHTVNQPTQPPVATGLGQQEDVLIERATSPEDEVDDIAPRRAI
jgi:hypothetical protein